MVGDSGDECALEAFSSNVSIVTIQAQTLFHYWLIMHIKLMCANIYVYVFVAQEAIPRKVPRPYIQYQVDKTCITWAIHIFSRNQQIQISPKSTTRTSINLKQYYTTNNNQVSNKLSQWIAAYES